jgi:type I restriction enzyme S subunit
MASEWVSLRLGDVCTKIGSGATPRGGSEVYLDCGPYSLIRSQNVYNEGFHHDGLAFINEEQASDLRNVEVEMHDVLLNITGDSVARVCQVDPSVLPARVNQHVAIVRPDPQKLDPRFLRYSLISPAMQATLLSWAGAGATRDALTKGMIESIDVIAPKEISEQQAIAHVLGSLDEKIEVNEKIRETLEDMGRALFRSWFIDFDPVRAKSEGRDTMLPKCTAALFSDSFEKSTIGDIPTGWKTYPLYDMAEFVNGAAYKDMHFSGEGVGLPVVKIAELKAGVTRNTRYAQTNLGEKYRIECKEILFSWSGNPDTSIDTFIWSDGPAWLNQHIFRVRGNGRASRARIYFQLKALRSVFAELARNKQTTGLGHVTISDMKKLLICDPSENVTLAFDNYASPLLERIIASQLQNERLAALRNALLPKLISGELRVGDFSSQARERNG